MISFGEILLSEHKSSLNQDAQDCLGRIVNSGQRMRLMIDGMLSLAKVTREELHRENVDLSTLALSLRDQLASIDPNRKIEFAVAPDLEAKGDPRLLALLLQNLLNNAWKFTAKKEKAKIGFGQTEQNSEKVFYVKDNGAGFDMKYASKLFGSFQRLHSEAEFAGTGIGLATVQRIVRRHKGKIWAQSAVNEGTTFFFTLPDLVEKNE